MFENIFSDESLINYLHLLENILFDSSEVDNQKSEKYTKYNQKLHQFAFQALRNCIPSKLYLNLKTEFSSNK